MAEARVVKGVEGLKELVGEHIGYSDWHQVTQDQVNLFADATGDHQWIHVDPERAKSGPFGGPIAHGYLTLALVPYFLPTILQVGRLREELVSAPFAMIETLEVLHRGWHVEGQSIRPDHRMVAHTGFLTVARRLADEPRSISGGE